MQELALSAAVGAFTWECIKQAIAAVYRKRIDQTANSKKLARDDISDIAKLIFEIQELSERYYTSGPLGPESVAMAKDIRIKLKTLGVKFNLLKQIEFIKKKCNASNVNMIKFRQSVSLAIDQKSNTPIPDDAPEILAIYRSAHSFLSEMNSLRYEIA